MCLHTTAATLMMMTPPLGLRVISPAAIEQIWTEIRQVRVTQKSELSFFFHFWVNTPPVLHPTEFFHCQYWNDPPNDGGSLEKSACSGRNISTIRSKIVWGARIPVIWVLIKPLNGKSRRLTRRSRATSPQSDLKVAHFSMDFQGEGLLSASTFNVKK